MASEDLGDLYENIIQGDALFPSVKGVIKRPHDTSVAVWKSMLPLLYLRFYIDVERIALARGRQILLGWEENDELAKWSISWEGKQ